MSTTPELPAHAPLGKTVLYPKAYDPSLLLPIRRIEARRSLGLSDSNPLPFVGWDLWNAYELSWLNSRGLPKIALLRIKVPCESDCIIESKSFKLYLNSFNQTRFETVQQIFDRLRQDLGQATGSHIDIELIGADQFANQVIREPEGIDLDKLDIEITRYQPEPALLILDQARTRTVPQHVTEKVFSRLLKSNCPVTDQPDWACISIEYTGDAIDHSGLLKYIVSYRTHNGFHEHCVEKIFHDIMSRCKPVALSVYARYTRRGGLDINPWRSTHNSPPQTDRSARQ